ncbi:MAG TPA: hypothetical protein VMU07_00950 [Candidatus Paceibacterota bacterium]|nr:hypothetical protein [Candidatus Paceibacterota bacterium]
MWERISRAKRRLTHGIRSIAAKYKKAQPDSRVSDVHAGPSANTVMLRERTFRVEFEINRRSIKKFFKKYKIPVVAFSAVLVMGIFVRFLLVGFATTADFYPTSCLGSWDNVQNALGKPDLDGPSPASAYTPLNSAIFSTSTAQMFCGNFAGDADISQFAGKKFQSAQIVLSWYVEPASMAQPGASGSVGGSGGVNGGGGGGGGGGSGGGSSIDTSSTDLSAATTSNAASPATSTDQGGGQSAATTTQDAAATSTDQASTTPDSAATSTAATSTVASTTTATTTTATTTQDQTAATSTDASASSQTDTSTQQAAPPPPPPPTTDPSSPPPSSWLYHLIPVAFADSVSSTPIATSTATSGLSLVVATSVTGVPSTATLPAPITVNTQSFQNIVLPSSTPDDFLGIVYSTDGVTWQPLVDIHEDNWQTSRYDLPITSWDELKHLQVAFVGLGQANPPKIYLDAVGVEVSYIDTPEAMTTVTPAPDDQSVDASSTDVQSESQQPTGPVIQQQSMAQSDIFQQGAEQQCVAVPFSQTVSPGGSAAFNLQLFSGLTTPFSKPKKGTTATSTLPQGYQHPIYDIRLGSLPSGVSYVLNHGPMSDATSTAAIIMNVSSKATQGSYSLLVIYRERQDDASFRSTGCQLNLVIQ